MKISSTTSSMPSSFSKRSFIGLTDATEAPVLSVMMATVLGLVPVALSAILTITGNDCSACEAAVAEVWNTYLKPREVIRSE